MQCCFDQVELLELLGVDLEDIGGAEDVDGIDDARHGRVTLQLVDPLCHESSLVRISELSVSVRGTE